MLDFSNGILGANVITSRQNPTVKRICALEQKKKRQEEGLFRFDGVKLFCEAINSNVKIKYAVISSEATDAAKEALSSAVLDGRLDKDRVIEVSKEVFEKLSDERSPEGIITVAELLKNRHTHLTENEAESYRLPEKQRILIVESMRDAGNLGTLVRTCSALGIDKLVLSDDCADLYNPKTLRAAMGGIFKLHVDILPAESMPEAIKSLRHGGRKIYATALHRDAVCIGELALECGDAFVIGNEGHGLSQGVIDACDGCVIIPMSEGSESLNAAVAAAICIWETVR